MPRKTGLWRQQHPNHNLKESMMRYADQPLFAHDTIQFGATAHAQATAAPHLDPTAYLSAFLLFQNALPDHVSADLSPEVAAAVQYRLDHPEPVASYEYMQALLNLTRAGEVTHNVSLTAIDHIAPEVAAYMQAQVVAPIQHDGGF